MRTRFLRGGAALLLSTFTLVACGESTPAETTGTTVTEDLVDGTDGGLDSLDLPENATATDALADTVQ